MIFDVVGGDYYFYGILFDIISLLSHAKNATPAWNMPILSTRILG